ncbi:MAG: 3-oxoacyl-[acyl-carrier-protein] synthase, partial [Solirubrobacteraceae bacterium]|nr:3-oxoacyl-[acyl-carrier-protein] synthase [Solirubrobacteraceae bacterium]
MLDPANLATALPGAQGAIAEAGDGLVRGAAIVSVATALPEGRLSTVDLAEQLGVSDEWIMSRTGVRERRRAGADERLSDYATEAGARALKAAGVPAADVDLVLVATMTQDE